MKMLVVIVFAGFDFLVGFLAAKSKGTVSSSIMRVGLYHKAGNILLMGLFYIVEWIEQYIDLNIPFDITTPICVYISIMEIISIIENLHILNPDLIPESIWQIIGKEKNEYN